MNRTSSLSRLLLPALLAVAPACDDDSKCIALQLECRGVCIDYMADNSNCGTCGNVCATGTTCSAGQCEAGCTAPEESCGGVCTNTDTSAQHCGDCDTACATGGTCVAGACANPLALLRTTFLDGAEVRDLHVVQDRTFALTKLNATGFVADHVLLPNGDVLVVGDLAVDGVFEVFRLPAGGGAPSKVSAPLTGGADAIEGGFVVSEDGSRVLYRVDNGDGAIDLYAAALASPGTAVRLNNTLTADRTVSRVTALTADGRRAVYIADDEDRDLDDVYTVDLSTATPGAPVRISGDTFNDVYDFQMSRDGRKVVFRGGSFSPSLSVVDATAPGKPAAVNNDGGEGYVEAYQLLADGSRVFYTHDPSFLDQSLFVASLATTPVEPELLVDGSGNAGVRSDFVATEDGARVYFRRANNDDSLHRLYRLDVATPATPTLLSAPGTDRADTVADFALSRDGRSLAFRSGGDGAEGGFPLAGTVQDERDAGYAPALELVDLSAATPAAPVRLTPDPAGKREGIAQGFRVTDDRRVLFRADFDTATFSDAYIAALATAGTIRKISPPLDETTDATDVSLITLF